MMTRQSIKVNFSVVNSFLRGPATPLEMANPWIVIGCQTCSLTIGQETWWVFEYLESEGDDPR